MLIRQVFTVDFISQPCSAATHTGRFCDWWSFRQATGTPQLAHLRLKLEINLIIVIATDSVIAIAIAIAIATVTAIAIIIAIFIVVANFYFSAHGTQIHEG